MTPELSKLIKQYPFPFLSETFPRKSGVTQICLHHTASGPGVEGDFEWWKKDGQPVSTPIIIGRDGIINQIYSTDLWAYTLGLNQVDRAYVESVTVGIEIDLWGWLTKKGDKFYSWADTEIPKDRVCDLGKPFRGQQYFEKITAAQINSVKLLLEHLGPKFKVPLAYREIEMWNLSDNAKHAKVRGLYTHCSFRSDKTDIYPDPDLITMLKALI